MVLMIQGAGMTEFWNYDNEKVIHRHTSLSRWSVYEHEVVECFVTEDVGMELFNLCCMSPYLPCLDITILESCVPCFLLLPSLQFYEMVLYT